MATMKAVRMHGYGGPEVLKYEDAPRPEPVEGEALVKVHAAGVNPVDWKIRAGYLRAFREYPLPFILGWDFSGVIEGVGSGPPAPAPTGFNAGVTVGATVGDGLGLGVGVGTMHGA